jgi:hypothetical protein
MTNGEDTNSKKNILIIQILIPLAILILTPITTSFVVSFQLSKQHEYWQKEQRLHLVEQEFQSRMKLFSDVVGQINRLNNLLLSFQLYSESRDTAQSLTRILKKLKHSEVDHYWKEFQGFREKARTAYLEILEVKANLIQTQSACIILYGKKIEPLFVNYIRKSGDTIPVS